MARSTVLASAKKLIEKENKKLKFQIKKFLRSKPRESRRKQIIKIKAIINEIETLKNSINNKFKCSSWEKKPTKNKVDISYLRKKGETQL